MDESLVAGTGNEIVADFYRRAVAGVPAGVRRFVENELITERGFRKPCDVDDARTVHGVSEADLSLLVNRRLVHLDPSRRALRVELTHDLLTRVVREERDRQREFDRRTKERKERRRLIGVGAFLGLVALTLGALAYYANAEKGRAQAALEEVETTTKRQLQTQKDLEQQRIAAGISEATAEVKGRVATSNELAGAAVAKLNDGDPLGGISLALEAIAATRDKDNTILPTAEGALRRTAFATMAALDRPGHSEAVDRIELSPDEKRVATSGGDRVNIWDIARANQLHSFPACSIHEFSRDWKKLACSDGYAVDFRDVETEKVFEHIGGHRGRVAQVGFSPDGKYTLWGNGGETYVSGGGSNDRRFEGESAVFSANGKMLATVVGQEPSNGVAKVWDVESGQEKRSSPAHVANGFVALSPDGGMLAFFEEPLGLGTFGGLNIIYVDSGKTVRLNYQATCVAFDADGSRLAALGASGRLVDPLSSAEVVIPDDPEIGQGILRVEARDPAACRRFLPDGSALFFETSFLSPLTSGVLDLKTGRVIEQTQADFLSFHCGH